MTATLSPEPLPTDVAQPGDRPPKVRTRPSGARSLFDGTNQGIALTDAPAFSFQGHPEASPGPHDASYLFDRFVGLMDSARNDTATKKDA